MSKPGHGHEDFDECEGIVRGAIHELEHTNDWSEAMDIAADHLRERDDYYDLLESCMGEDDQVGHVKPNGVDLSDQRWRCFWLYGTWHQLPHGLVHSQAAERIVRDDPELLSEYRTWNRNDFPAFEEYLLDTQGAIKQWGLMFFTKENPRWALVKQIQERVLQMQPAPSSAVDVYFGYEKDSPGYELSVDDFVNAKSFRDIKAASEKWEMTPNGPEMVVAAELAPVAVDLALKHPKDALKVIDYAAMVFVPFYLQGRLAMMGGKWAYRKGKKALGYEKNGSFASLVSAAPAALRPYAENILKWLLACYKMVISGAGKDEVVKFLRENKIANRLAGAMADAVIAVVAEETGEAVKRGGRALRRRALGDEVNGNPGMPEPDLYPNPGRYYVWAMTPRRKGMEGPWGPYQYQNARTYARIAAQKGEMDRVVTMGKDPETLTIKRIYEAGTGAHLYTDKDG